MVYRILRVSSSTVWPISSLISKYRFTGIDGIPKIPSAQWRWIGYVVLCRKSGAKVSPKIIGVRRNLIKQKIFWDRERDKSINNRRPNFPEERSRRGPKFDARTSAHCAGKINSRTNLTEWYELKVTLVVRNWFSKYLRSNHQTCLRLIIRFVQIEYRVTGFVGKKVQKRKFSETVQKR